MINLHTAHPTNLQPHPLPTPASVQPSLQVSNAAARTLAPRPNVPYMKAGLNLLKWLLSLPLARRPAVARDGSITPKDLLALIGRDSPLRALDRSKLKPLAAWAQQRPSEWNAFVQRPAQPGVLNAARVNVLFDEEVYAGNIGVNVANANEHLKAAISLPPAEQGARLLHALESLYNVQGQIDQVMARGLNPAAISRGLTGRSNANWQLAFSNFGKKITSQLIDTAGHATLELSATPMPAKPQELLSTFKAVDQKYSMLGKALGTALQWSRFSGLAQDAALKKSFDEAVTEVSHAFFDSFSAAFSKAKPAGHFLTDIAIKQKLPNDDISGLRSEYRKDMRNIYGAAWMLFSNNRLEDMGEDMVKLHDGDKAADYLVATQSNPAIKRDGGMLYWGFGQASNPRFPGTEYYWADGAELKLHGVPSSFLRHLPVQLTSRLNGNRSGGFVATNLPGTVKSGPNRGDRAAG